MATERSVMVVGGGKMGEALAAGLVRCGWARPADVSVVETDPDRRAYLSSRYPDLRLVDAGDVVDGPTPGGAIAVKPVDVEAACLFLRTIRPGRVLSIAAGVTLTSLELWLDTAGGAGRQAAVIRAMPNTPALIGCGASAIAAGRVAGPEDVQWAEEILAAVGTVLVVPEPALDAVTGLSGSGPAYVFLLAEALMAAGESVGLSRAESRQLVVQTLLGSARLLAESGEEPAALRAAVTSPGGTTAAGLRVLDQAGLRQSVAEAVAAATERSRELGRPG